MTGKTQALGAQVDQGVGRLVVERADAGPPEDREQAKWCRYGMCRPGEQHMTWCTEYASTETPEEKAAALDAARARVQASGRPSLDDLIKRFGGII